MPDGLSVAIMGAGPAGCTLALLLLQNPSVKVTVFEGESSAHARTQGGTLDLHVKTGQAALKRVGLYGEFQRRARYEGEALIIANSQLRRYVNMSGGKEGDRSGRPEIDRESLREMLLAAMPAGIIRWGHKLVSISDTDDDDDGQRTAIFANGTQERFDLIIGAEGTWSKTRRALTTIKPAFAGMVGVRLRITDVAKRYPDLHALVNKGSLFTGDDHKYLTAQQLGDGSLCVGAFTLKHEEWIQNSGFDPHNLEALKAATLKEFEGWAPELRRFIEVADADPWISNMYSLPIGHRWACRGNVTLIGDAAHVFTPFAGEGVNLAMADAMALADAVLMTAKEGKHRMGANIKEFEEDMFIRMKKFAELTYGNVVAIFFSEDKMDGWIERMISNMASDEVPWVLKPVVDVAIKAYYWYFRRFC